MKIPAEYFKNDTVHRYIGTDGVGGLLTCGFLNKRTKSASDIDLVFESYGALLLLSGEGMHVDNSGQEYRLYPGCFVQRIPGKRHSTHVKPDGKWLEFFICFDKVLFEALVGINALSAKEDVLYPGLNMALFEELVGFMKQLKAAPKEELAFLLAKAQRIIFTIYKMHSDQKVSDENLDIIRRACHVIQNDLAGCKSALEISRMFGMGYETFRKVFKANMGISPGRYRVLERINRAKAQLVDTDKSIKQIALELGFSDPFSFSKQFKRVTGIAPKEFRKRY